ncbi:2-oxoacid:acceptor oxidoreductase family protein [Candidatus Sumerlaeota bacterium]|nr:2-oxoacid:acceptor oxidoreductase family protein [Candidatus Sumerlaeota bacterium]
MIQEIKIAGFGGQGVILAGEILGKAATIYDGKFATLTHSYGPEARGGACGAQIIISDEKIAYPYVIRPDILVVMSQEAYEKYVPELKKGGLLILEQELVSPGNNPDIKTFSIPATRMAEELGSRIVLNIVMLGFLTAISRIASYDGMAGAIRETVPKGMEYININAFDKGYQFGLGQVKQAFANGK